MDKEIKHVNPDCICKGLLCPTCRVFKCVEHFKKKRGNPEILNKGCRSCYDTNQKWHDKHPEVIQRIHEKLKPRKVENAKKWNQAHPEERKQYRKNHKEKQLRENREKYLEEKRKGVKKWEEEHREQYRHIKRVNDAKRRSAIKASTGAYSLVEWEELKGQFNNTCLCCKKQEPEIRLTADHVIPVSKGGTNTIENIQPLCRSCNSRKKANIIDYRSRKASL